MQNSSKARKYGVIGILGSVLWIISVILQFSLNLFDSVGSGIWFMHQLLAMIALVGVVIGFLGLISGGAVVNTFGKTTVYLYVVARGLIILGGLFNLFLQGQESPIFLVFPIGGTLGDLAALLIGIAVIIAKRWSGWQRWMPMIHFLVTFFGISLPMGLGIINSPGMVAELVQGIVWFGVALAVYKSTDQKSVTSVTSQPV